MTSRYPSKAEIRRLAKETREALASTVRFATVDAIEDVELAEKTLQRASRTMKAFEDRVRLRLAQPPGGG